MKRTVSAHSVRRMSCHICSLTYPKKFAQTRVVRLARLALGILDVLCEPETADFQHAIDGIFGGSDGYEGIGGIEIVPVFEVRGGLEELGWQREADGGEIGNTNEPEQQKVNTRWLWGKLGCERTF